MKRRFFLQLALAAGLQFAAAAVPAEGGDYERGFRDGYDRGFEAGRESARHESFRDGRKNYYGPAPSQLPAGIIVIGATYGDSRNRCDLTAWAAQQFNRRTSASAEVSNSLCGDPAPGRRKSLNVEYLCRGERRTGAAYEHRTLSINCF